MRKDKEFFRLSVIITVKNERGSINVLLDSLESQTAMPKEIIFVDGGSTDGTAEIIKKRMKKNKRIKLIIARGTSIAAGRNIGISNSVSGIIAMTDAGCVIDKNWLINITKPFSIRPEIGIVTGSYRMTGKSLLQEAVKAYLGTPFKLATSSNFLPSARSIAFRKSIWEKVGGFSEDLELAGEDTLFNYQAKKKGIKFYFAKKAVVDWEIPSGLGEIFKKLYFYAKGDAQTGIWWHPEKKLTTHNIKIMAIYLRYLAGAALLFLSLTNSIFFEILIFLFFSYFAWAILKNYYKVEKKSAIILLPFIQIISDISVMLGFASGILSKL